jgi:putative NIF3 family GTP cyclohydrolase 1 type 2
VQRSNTQSNNFYFTFRYYLFIEAGRLGISLYDAGHFNTEDVIVSPLCRDIAGAFPEIDVSECHFSKIESI